MRDDLIGGVLATVVAAPALVVCCGGGALLAATLGAVGGWLSGHGGVVALAATAAVALAWRAMRRRGKSDGCCAPVVESKGAGNG